MNFENTDFRLEELDLKNPFDIKLVTKFLFDMDLTYSPIEVDGTIMLYNLASEIIGTGSYQGRILKYVAVTPKFRETGAFAQIVTHLTEKLLKKHNHSFVFTKPETAILFEGLGYTKIASAPPLFCVLEFGYKNIHDYQKYLECFKMPEINTNIASIVVNCNPFTNGHKFLIETTAQSNDIVYLFVVEEDKSVFSFDIRWKLIEKGISHLKNVIMIRGGQYIVSGGIFPSYFLKKEHTEQIIQLQAELDVTIFLKYIVPVLNITKRYIGTENYCITTKAYNQAMHKILTPAGIQVIEITRKSVGKDLDGLPNYISASKVREAIKNNQLADIIDFLPDSTREFLLSEAAKEIIERIKTSKQRH